MKTQPLLPLLALAAGLSLPATLLAQHAEHQAKAEAPAAKEVRLDEPTEKDTAWLAQARAAYPLGTCLVSDEKLGDMGDVTERIYRRAGQPDRLVRFCCDGCVDDFKKEPAKYLKLLDAAAKPADKPHHH